MVSIGDAPRVSPIDDDILAYKLVTNKELFEHELGLYTTKWFDYRELTPLQATWLYLEAFAEAYKHHYCQNFDVETGRFATPVTIERILRALKEWETSPPPDAGPLQLKEREKRIRKARTTFVGCWRGRQVADALGMPYGVYVDLALIARLNYWNRRNMPQATHLYSEMVVEKVQERWEELQARKLYLSDRPAYLVQNYAGIAHQDDYHEWLFKQANLRSNPAAFLARFVNDDMLPIEKVEARCDEFMLERVRRNILN